MTSRASISSSDKKDIEDGTITASLIPSSSSAFDDQTLTTSNDINDIETKRKIKRVRRKVVDHSPIIKYGSLILLVAQLVGLVMLMRYSRTHTNGKDLYLSSTAVFLMEVRMYNLLNHFVSIVFTIIHPPFLFPLLSTLYS